MKTCLFYIGNVLFSRCWHPPWSTIYPTLASCDHTHKHTHTYTHTRTHFLSFIFSCTLPLSLRVKKVSPNTTYFSSPFGI